MSSEESNKKRTRREVYRTTATRRAEHFARGESSTTPTGNLRRKGDSSGDNAEDDVWPGLNCLFS